MKRILLGVVLALTFCSFATPRMSLAADADINVRKKAATVHRATNECRGRRCVPSCPYLYSCTPLYGAYGPWGGEHYWASYSYSPGPRAY
jgi:hypothetical protein